MTYKDLLDKLEEVCNDHLFVQTYGYGDLSDIEVPDNEEPPNYPYVFINPVQTSIDKQSFTFDCNMIVMTQVNDNEDEEIEGQDLCIRIIQDVVSHFVTTTDDFVAVSFPVTTTPFKERFQDKVVGATADLQIVYGKSIDGCNNPIS